MDVHSADGAHVAPSGRRLQLALVFILVNVTLDSLAVTIVGPVMPALLKSLTGGAMAQMSTVFGAIAVVFATMQLIAGPVQGALSDRFGRRPIVLISTVGVAIYFVCLALTPNLTWVFVGVVIAGAAAGGVTAAIAYVADISKPEQRAARFGLVSAALSAGGACGSLIGGFMGEIDPRDRAVWRARHVARGFRGSDPGDGGGWLRADRLDVHRFGLRRRTRWGRGTARLSIINRIIGASDRGRLSGAERSVDSLTGILAPAAFAALFAAVVAGPPDSLLVGVPLLVGAALMAVGLLVTIWSVDRTMVIEPRA